MKNSKLILLILFSSIVLHTNYALSQFSEKFTVTFTIYEEPGQLIGVTNLDSDPQNEIVTCWYSDGNEIKIYVIDGISGTIDWESEIFDCDRYSYSEQAWHLPLNISLADIDNDGIGEISFIGQKSNDNRPKLYVFESQGGIFVEKINNNILPAKSELSQNYPNPFNPTTKINYTVQKAGLVEIKIYNSLGQVIRTILNEYKPVGEYEVIWDGKDNSRVMVSSGTYFYQLKIDDFLSSKKMLLLK